jgi:phospholipase/carboxylesterase
MFHVDIARAAKDVLTGAGADLIYREIADLSHTYPSDENSHIMEWFLAGGR